MWLNDFIFGVLMNFTAFAGVNVFTAFFQAPITIFTNVVSTLLSGLISP